MAGITPLHFCIFRGNNEQAISIIESGECDLDAGDAGGQTPCHIACYRDNIDIVKKLLETGADPSKADKSGNTPMHAAAGEGAMAVAKYFVEKGVSSSVKNADGFTPLELAERHCPPRSRVTMLKLLEQHAATQAEERKKDDEEARLKLEIEEMQRQLQLQQQQQKPQQPKTRFLQVSQPPSPASLTDDVPKRASGGIGGGRGGGNARQANTHGSSRNIGNGSGNTGDAVVGGSQGTRAGSGLGGGESQGSSVETEAQAMVAARDSGDPLQQALYRMLLRQHQSIDALTKVVETQANTIAAMVPLVGGRGSARSVKAAKERRATSASANGVRGGSGGVGGDGSGAVEEADVEAIAEMVAYLDDDVPPSSEAAVAAVTVAGEWTS